MKPIVRLETDSNSGWDDDITIVLELDGKELGRYCIVEDPEGERDDFAKVIDAVYDAGFRDGAENAELQAENAELHARLYALTGRGDMANTLAEAIQAAEVCDET